MNKIYIVVHTCGSYSDWSMENIAAFLDPTKAELFALEKNEQLVRCNKAKAEQYEHLRIWQKENDWQETEEYQQDRKRRSDIERVKKKDRTAKQVNDLLLIEQRLQELVQTRIQYNQQYVAEQKRFINGLEYLTEEDKASINEGFGQFQTDGSYDVEEIELKG